MKYYSDKYFDIFYTFTVILYWRNIHFYSKSPKPTQDSIAHNRCFCHVCAGNQTIGSASSVDIQKFKYLVHSLKFNKACWTIYPVYLLKLRAQLSLYTLFISLKLEHGFIFCKVVPVFLECFYYLL